MPSKKVNLVLSLQLGYVYGPHIILQSIVPCELLEQYLNMAEPSRSQTVDGDILKHCAFSLPGVAKTLGQRNWACLRQLYQHLARNMQVGLNLW